jgi:hypothetical protein
MSLSHKTIFEDSSKVELNLELIPELQAYHHHGRFPLLLDPHQRQQALFLGMFVLRPMSQPWTASILQDSSQEKLSPALYELAGGWSFNFKGLEGGWLIANGCAVDGYRLGFQYGISDAVIIGSRSVCEEGCDPLPSSDSASAQGDANHRRGYIWQPYGPLQWSHIKAIDAELVEKVAKQRVRWQEQGLLSSRKYPAQIIITWSGEKYESARDFLEARVFNEVHPDGSPYEVYIITSTRGAERIRQRASTYGFNSKRIDEILIIASPEGNPEDIDLQSLPSLLYRRYDMRLINHDGGQYVLDKFIQAKILPQMNLSLCRKHSLEQVLQSSSILSVEQRSYALMHYPGNCQNFFTSSVDGSVPRSLQAFQVIVDEHEDIGIVCFDSRSLDRL